jgi:hypothetical protein
MSFKVIIVTVETFMAPIYEPLHINCLERERERDNKEEKIYMKTTI